ncbi:MAG: hypothetical protein JSS65_04585 [Armatimonadetes bacterium]|nr:hypothetical protein [Armatimonadota bacterium]
MRSLILLALASAMLFAVGCGPAEKEGLANPPATPAATGTKSPETESPKPSTPAPAAGEKNPAEVDKVPEKPLPGPDAAPTLGK